MAALRRPALVLMDLFMPGMNGYEATRCLRQMPDLGRIPILALSASTTGIERQNSLEVGCDDFVPKPVRASVLLDKIGHLLGLEWVCGEEAAPARLASSSLPTPVMDDQALERPAAEDVARLSRLAIAGRIQDVLQEAARIERENPRSGPWLQRIKALAQSFQLRKLQELLKPLSS